MKDLKIYFSVGSILLIIYLIVQYNQPKPVDWTPTFSRRDKIPFGSYIFYKRLSDIFPGAAIRSFQQPPYLTLREEALNPGSYLVVTQSVKLDEYDFRELEKYMRKGNDVFIATYYLGDYIEDTLKTKISSELKPFAKQATAVRFVSPSLNPSRKYIFDRDIGNQYFSSYDTARAIVLGVNDKGHPNFIRYAFGDGHLYLIGSPCFFSNYNLLKEEGADYAAKALSYLRPSQDVVWDDFSALGSAEAGSPVRVFLEHESLRSAYYLALFTLALFVLYQIKRRQRIIPIVEPLQNNAKEFATVVGQVYYQQRDNSNIANKKVVYLLEEVRSRYNIKTQTLNSEFAELLIRKSGASRELIMDLLRQILQLRKFSHVSDQELIELNKNIELFHQQSR